MKKKASLLISGITTVAMLAVAVGSFAAWDTLTGTTGALTVKNSDPVVLSVTPGKTSEDTIRLAAGLVDSTTTTASDIVDSTHRSSEVTIGDFQAKFTNNDQVSMNDYKTVFVPTITYGDSDTAATGTYTVTLEDTESSPTTYTANSTDLGLGIADKKFNVKIAATNIPVAEQNQNLKVTIEVKVLKK